MKCCLMLPVLFGICSAQTPTRPAFEAVTVKRNISGDAAHGFAVLPSGVFRATNIPASTLVRFAYDVSNQTMVGAPGWLDSDHYDISAKARAGISYDELRFLMQTLFEDEFKMAVHHEPRNDERLRADRHEESSEATGRGL